MIVSKLKADGGSQYILHMLQKLSLMLFSTFALGLLSASGRVVSGPEETEVYSRDSCFVHIDSNAYAITDELPRYADEVYVGDICPQGYSVSICYPEFKALSSRELKAVRKLQSEGLLESDNAIDQRGTLLAPCLSPTCGLELEQFMTVSRRKGYLNISFCPIVRHEGEWKRILSCQMKVRSNASEGQTLRSAAKAPEMTERWKEESVLSKGKWAKVRVEKEGIYQLTASDIQKMGFTDLNKVKVYGYGGLVQNAKMDFSTPNEAVLAENVTDDLEEVPTMKEGDRLLFWAEGTIKSVWTSSTSSYTHQQNTYSNYSYYFITENDEQRAEVALRNTENINNANLPKVTTVPFMTVLDKDAFGWYSGGTKMFDSHDFSSNQTNSYRLETPGINHEASGTKSIVVSFSAASSLSSTGVTINANGTNVGQMTVDKYNPDHALALVTTKTFDKLQMLKGNEGNVFQFTTSNNNKARFDYVRVNYPRNLEVSAQPYSFSPRTRDAACLQISGANDHTHLWMIGQRGSVTTEIPTTLNAEGVLEGVAEYPTRRFVVFDASATYSAPEYVGEVKNQNLHSHNGIDYVIIIPANGILADQAARLGKLHADKEGMTYSVVRADELYNEFSSGTPDVNAYRRYLKMLYDRAGDDEDQMPKYCLLMGKSPWDNRLVTPEWAGHKAEDYLLAYEADGAMSSIGSEYSYVTDDFFAMLDDGEGAAMTTEKPDIAMGRMVCTTVQEAERLVGKVESYIKNEYPGSWKNTVAVLADDGDNNGHMKDAENVVKVLEDCAPNLDIQKVYWDRYTWTSSSTGYTYPVASARIKQLMTEGASIFNYSGHGSPGMISHQKVLTLPDFKAVYSPYMTLWVLASCEIYPFDSEEDNMAESSMYTEQGGSIGFMCATRSVYADRNNYLNTAYCRYLLTPNAHGEFNTMGEALRLSKIHLVTTSSNADRTINKLKYVFFGDPALKLAIPTGQIVLDSINGKSIDDIKNLETLSAGSVARFSGHVCKPGSLVDIDLDFDGTVSATIYDRKETVTCKDNKKSTSGNPMVFTERAKSIFKGSTKAEGGKFTFHAAIPRDISYSDEAGRISFYAINNEKTTEYNGYSETFCLNGTSENLAPDSIAPTVIAYINSIDNPDYTVTDENPVLIADISDDSGINNSGTSLGHDIELVLDGNMADYINLNSYFNYDFGSYQKGQLVYQMNNMERGPHTAQLRVWDVNNNVATTDVHFIVRSENAQGGKDGYITATKNPATTDTRFITYFPKDAEADGLVTYEVYDTRGRCVFKQPVTLADGSTSSTFTWDLCGNDRQPLPGGIYFYRSVIVTKQGVVNTDAQKLIITQK